MHVVSSMDKIMESSQWSCNLVVICGHCTLVENCRKALKGAQGWAVQLSAPSAIFCTKGMAEVDSVSVHLHRSCRHTLRFAFSFKSWHGKVFLVLVLLQLKCFELQKAVCFFSYLSHPLGHQICVSVIARVTKRDPKYFKQRDFCQQGNQRTAPGMWHRSVACLNDNLFCWRCFLKFPEIMWFWPEAYRGQVSELRAVALPQDVGKLPGYRIFQGVWCY